MAKNSSKRVEIKISGFSGRTRALVDLEAILENLKSLTQAAARQMRNYTGAVPMVKCNAYGHGAGEVAGVLQSQALAFGVASVEEGRALRQAKIEKPIWIFSDTAVWTRERSALFQRDGLTPLFFRLEDLAAHLKEQSPQPFHLKFNTGMNRLGIECSEIAEVRRLLSKNGNLLEGICAHFADGENPSSKLTQLQAKVFSEICAELSSFNPKHVHAANTASVSNIAQIPVLRSCNVIRPGIGLYGYGAPKLKLKPALQWQAKVILARELKSGDAVGYGGTFKASRKIWESVLAVGYGDGLSRRLSNSKILLGPVPTHFTKILGRVSMDNVGIEGKFSPGSYVTLLGETSAQAELWSKCLETIPYELLTGISSRVERVYIK